MGGANVRLASPATGASLNERNLSLSIIATTLPEPNASTPGDAALPSILDRIPDLRAIVAQSGFVCLDSDWKGWDARYRFLCAHDHVFLKFLRKSTLAAPCPVCESNRLNERLHALVREAGVTCLEPGWLGANAKHRFRCAEGHAWERRGRNVLVSARCPECSRVQDALRRRRPEGLADLKAAAAQRGGQCLADRYEGVEHVYAFQCAKGHVWKTRGAMVLGRNWCPECAARHRGQQRRYADGLARLCAAAASRGGECLSAAYEGAAAYYRFRCGAGHEWETSGRKVFEGHWCMACVYDAKRLSLEVARQAAAERGGQCLSDHYEGAAARMYWLCHRGHAWRASLSNVRAGHWCPDCANMNKITNRKSKARRRYQPA